MSKRGIHEGTNLGVPCLVTDNPFYPPREPQIRAIFVYMKQPIATKPLVEVIFENFFQSLESRKEFSKKMISELKNAAQKGELQKSEIVKQILEFPKI